MRSLVASYFLVGSAEVVDAPLRIVPQAANVRFDHCDLFSFLPFEGDLVIRKVQG